jgi:outer membrane protein OmpA-like peptidoglycan-associated protein
MTSVTTMTTIQTASPTLGLTLARAGFSKAALGALVSSAMILQGCANSGMTAEQQATLNGALIGAVGGAVISSATGGKAGTGAVIGGVAGAVAGNVWSRHMEAKRKALEQASAGTGIEVARTADNRLKLNIPSDFSFDTNSAVVKPSMQPVLNEIARGLDTTVKVDVIGHTDSRGSDAINQPLSVRRADAVRTYLETRGVASQRINIAGAGSSQPVASNDTDAGRAQNRRVEIFLADSGAAATVR